MTDVSTRFGRKARIYDEYASVQTDAGIELFRCLDSAFPGMRWSKAADLGAGTGNLVSGLALRADSVLALDASSDMLGVLKERHPFAQTACADFDSPEFLSRIAGCDLAASCFALQWSRDVPGIIESLGRSGKTAALAFPVRGTLSELKQAFCDAGAAHFINEFPETETVHRSVCASFADVKLFSVKRHCVCFHDFLSLLRSVTKIGASSLMSESGSRLSKSVLLSAAASGVWKGQSQNKFCAAYEVAYIIAH